MPTAATMTLIEAAAYVGLTDRQFRRAVARHEMPEPLIKSRPQRWSRVQIDWALEGRLEKSAPWAERDPLMEHLERCGSR
ncbi:hypothetical protein [Paramagnetospirillum magneticum]|uniref:Uncharacterized protein n=1 Tax=Paramagnetospirillum magneticum (strain ATCC 700264 / AMB-1) TaxID=342108 RepID=Q2W3R1_PARM1|nr:hypothetical protein [Paramagnetospirillum magneticum]BAE51514.1 hypothetical protein amb2710 [Paramagnetospirillum magneticum AMB-1]